MLAGLSPWVIHIQLPHGPIFQQICLFNELKYWETNYLLKQKERVTSLELTLEKAMEAATLLLLLSDRLQISY